MTRRNRAADDAAHDVLATDEFEIPAADPALRADRPHDVLATDEFEIPAADPALRADRPHDVLATDEFEIPAADPELLTVHRYVPDDPSGRPEPHDVLAADEFPMPARRPHGPATSAGSARVPKWTFLAVGAALALRAARRLR